MLFVKCYVATAIAVAIAVVIALTVANVIATVTFFVIILYSTLMLKFTNSVNSNGHIKPNGIVKRLQN